MLCSERALLEKGQCFDAAYIIIFLLLFLQPFLAHVDTGGFTKIK